MLSFIRKLKIEERATPLHYALVASTIFLALWFALFR